MTRPRCYFAFRSPYSRVGLHKLAPYAADIDLIAFTGPPDGVVFADPVANAPKLAYYIEDAPRMSSRLGLPFVAPSPRSTDFGPATRAFVAASREGLGWPFALAASDARWGEGRDLGDAAVIAACAEAAGWTDFDAETVINDPANAQTLQAQRALIESDGVFGVPFLVDGGDKYWGQDRFDLWLEARG